MKSLKPIYIYIAALFLITLFIRILLINYYDFNLGGIEPNVIYGIQRILLGQPLYQDPSAGSYAIIQYTPFWYYLIAGIAKLMSHDNYRQGLDVQGLYVLCRVVALIFNLLTAGVCMLIIRRWGISWLRSLVFAMPSLMVLTVHYYTRGDSMHLFLFVAAIYAYICYQEKRKLLHVISAALFSAACIMTKQSGVLVAGIISIGFFADRKYDVALLYVACLALFSWGIARSFNQGDWYTFYQNTVLGLKNGIDLSFLYTIFISQFFLDMVPCYILGGLMIFIAMKKVADKTYQTLLLGMACSWLFAVITGLKIGSSNNYFTEFLILLLVSLPYLLYNEQGKHVLFTYLGKKATTRVVAYIAFFILITSKTSGLFTAMYIEKNFKNDKKEYTNDQMLYEYFRNVLNIRSGEYVFFTERRYLDNVFVNYSIMPTKDVVAQTYSANKTTFDYSGLIKKMNLGLIKYIITDKRRDDINICADSLPFIWFDKDRFRLIAHVSGYSIYKWSPTGVL